MCVRYYMIQSCRTGRVLIHLYTKASVFVFGVGGKIILDESFVAGCTSPTYGLSNNLNSRDTLSVDCQVYLALVESFGWG
jgi:hypothetical protein